MTVYIIYREMPEHEYLHVVNAGEAVWDSPVLNAGALSLVANSRTFQPAEWAYLEDEGIEEGVIHQSKVKTVLYPNETVVTSALEV